MLKIIKNCWKIKEAIFKVSKLISSFSKLSFRFVVRFFAFCGQTIHDFKKCNKINVVWLEILNILVPLRIFLSKIFISTDFGSFYELFYFFCSLGLSNSSSIIISDRLKLLHESKVENTINFLFLEMCKQKFKVTEFEFPASK